MTVQLTVMFYDCMRILEGEYVGVGRLNLRLFLTVGMVMSSLTIFVLGPVLEWTHTHSKAAYLILMVRGRVPLCICQHFHSRLLVCEFTGSLTLCLILSLLACVSLCLPVSHVCFSLSLSLSFTHTLNGLASSCLYVDICVLTHLHLSACLCARACVGL